MAIHCRAVKNSHRGTIVCFFLSFHHMFLHVLSPPLSRLSPFSIWFTFCFSLSFQPRASLVLSSSTFLVLSSLLPLSFSSLLLAVLSFSASTYTFGSDSPFPIILGFSLSFHLDFFLSFHPLLPLLLTWSSTMIKFIISSAPSPPPPPRPFQTFFPGAIWHYCTKEKCLNINREILHKHIEQESQKILWK